MNDIAVRSTNPGELARVLYLFRKMPLPRQAKMLVAVRTVPVERFVGALGGWPEAEFLRFLLVFQPGVNPTEIASLLLTETETIGKTAGLQKLLYGELLGDDEPLALLLRENGFDVLRSERFFRVDGRVAEVRVGDMMRRHGAEVPANWRTESIRHHQPNTISDLVGKFKLMTHGEMSRYWGTSHVRAFEPEMSSIIFEGQRAFGTLLIRRMGEALFYDVRVVDHPNRRARSLANLLLFHHNMAHYDPTQYVRWLQFRGGEMEHRETANIAVRMGGIELPPRRVLVKSPLTWCRVRYCTSTL